MELREKKEFNFARISTYPKAVNSAAEVEQWLKDNKAKQLTAKDNTGKITSFNGRSKAGDKK